MATSQTRAHTATKRFASVGPRKARLLADLIREQRVDAALDTLRFNKKGFAQDLYKLVDSAVANVASSDLGWDLDRLYIAKIYVNEGPTMRRFRARAMGRATRIRKRTSHVTVELAEIE